MVLLYHVHVRRPFDPRCSVSWEMSMQTEGGYVLTAMRIPVRVVLEEDEIAIRAGNREPRHQLDQQIED